MLSVVSQTDNTPENNRDKDKRAKMMFLPALEEILCHLCACTWMSRP